MENTLAEYADRDLSLAVVSTPIADDWNIYRVVICCDDRTVRLNQYEIMPLVRMLFQAFELIQKDQEKESEAVTATV